MTGDELKTLMNQEIDGRNSPAESARLRELLAGDHEALREFTDLREITAMLDRMESRTPPPDLTPSILSLVRKTGRNAPSRPGTSWWTNLAEILRPQTLRLAYVFIAGLGLGIAGTMLVRIAPDSETLSGVSATLAPRASSLASGDLSSTPLRFDGVAGVARLRRAPGGFALVVETTTAGAVRAEMSLTMDGAGIRGHRIDQGTVQRLTAGPDGARWTLEGPGSITWYLSAGSGEGAAVNLIAEMEGREAFRTNFLVPAE